MTPTQMAVERAVAESIVAEPDTIPVPGTLDPNVQRGVDFLDAEYPGWAEKINLDTFDLIDMRYCVLGQVFGGYGRYVFMVFGDQDPSDYGVDISDEFDAIVDDDEHEAATKAEFWRLELDWRDAIRERQAR